MTNTAFDAFIARLTVARKIHDGHYLCHCPVHDDQKPRLDITLLGSRINLRCSIGCTPEKIVETMGLGMADLFLNGGQLSTSNSTPSVEPSHADTEPPGEVTHPVQRHTGGGRRDKFIMVPNVIDDLQLSACAFRLYAHIKRVTGEDGKCWQSQRELERLCKLSNRTVIKAKQELINAGLIECTLRMINGHAGHIIKPLDIWDKNEATAMNNSTCDDKEHARCTTIEPQCKTAPDCGVNQHLTVVNNSTSKNTPVNNTPEENPYEENPVGARRPFSREFIKEKYGHLP